MLNVHKETHQDFLSVNELHGSRSFIGLFSNLVTGTWTLVEYDKDKACVIGVGRRETT